MGASPDLAVESEVAPPRPCRVIAIVNQKGGVGKTTTTINLGSALAEKGSHVLLVDLDPQSNSTRGLGFDPRRSRQTVYQLLTGEATIDDVAIPTTVGGLHLIPSQLDLAGAEIELAGLPDRETRLRTALRELGGGFGHVLIDCPPSLGLLTLNALVAASEMLIPMQCEYFSLEGLGHLLYTQQLVRMNLNPNLDVTGIVMTQFDARTTLSWDVLAEVRRAYPDQVFKTLIPRNVRVSEAPSHGLSVLQYDSACRGSQAYRQLAEEVLAR
ncbi:MAG TPA: ParA family protein [Candidatus Dormibacteraeota bacterium]|nr:ParA family protein [Candidatus Dormibacteraeota bacterium]